MSDDFASLQRNEIGPRGVLTDELVRAVTRAYGLGDIAEARDLGGTYNLNVLLRTLDQAYIARMYRPWVTVARLQSTQQTRQALVQAGIPVPLPLATPVGNTWLAREGRLIEVEPYIAHDHSADSWERYAQSYALLGRLHTALAACEPAQRVPPRVSNYALPEQLLRWIANTEAVLGGRDEGATTTQALALCAEARAYIMSFHRWWLRASSDLPFQPTHGDYGGGNILFREDEIVALLDFDFLGVRERIFELAYTTYWMLARLQPATPPADYAWERVAASLALYNATTDHPLTELEWQGLPLEMARVPLY